MPPIDGDAAYQRLIDLQDEKIKELVERIANLQMELSSDPDREAIETEAAHATCEGIAEMILDWLKGERLQGVYGSKELEEAKQAVILIKTQLDELVESCRETDIPLEVLKVLIKHDLRHA